MRLDPSLRLEAVLAGAVTTSQPTYHVEYRYYNKEGVLTTPAPSRGAMNSTTDVILLAAPQQAFTTELVYLALYNLDTVNATFILKTDDGTTERTFFRPTLATLETLHYELGRGWYSTDANGALKTANGPAGVFTSLTVNGLVDISGASGGQIKFPGTQNASSNVNTLDDYEEYTAASAACTGAITTAAVWKLTKVGNLVTLTLPGVQGAGVAVASFTFGTAIPAAFID